MSWCSIQARKCIRMVKHKELWLVSDINVEKDENGNIKTEVTKIPMHALLRFFVEQLDKRYERKKQ